MSCEWRRTHAPTLTECDVNLVNSSFFVILYTFLAASCRIELIWISSIWHVFFLFLLVSVYTAMGLSFGILSFFALFLILLLALTKQCFLFLLSSMYDITCPLSLFFWYLHLMLVIHALVISLSESLLILLLLLALNSKSSKINAAEEPSILRWISLCFLRWVQSCAHHFF